MQQLRNVKRRIESRFTPEKLREMEQGQAIVLIALVMVSLIAFTGLAIDGGGLFLLFRDVQNASDAAAVAAAYALCTDASYASVENAALEAASDNGFVNDTVDDWVTVNNPPVSGERAGDSRYVQVTIRAMKPSHFIHIVYRGPLEVSVTAVSYCSAPFNPYTWNALTALGTDAQCTDGMNELQWSGSNGYIDGGAFSNGDVDMSGSSTDVIGPVSAVDDVAPDPAGNINYVTQPPTSGAAPLNDPGIYQMSDYVPGGNVATAVDYYWSPTTDTTGVFFNSDTWNGTTWRPRFDPDDTPLYGLFYVPGNVNIESAVDFDSTIGFSIAATGTLDVDSNETLKYYVNGMMFYSTYQSSNCGTSHMKFNGNTVSWQGVIYTPFANASFSGSNIDVIPGAIIAKTITISASDFTLIYDPEIFDPVPPTVQLAE